jgi:hypothetical protein
MAAEPHNEGAVCMVHNCSRAKHGSMQKAVAIDSFRDLCIPAGRSTAKRRGCCAPLLSLWPREPTALRNPIAACMML